MTTIGTPHLRALALGCALLIASDPAPLHAVQPAGQPVRVDPDDIGGVVTGPNGPEAGVWVIAETTDLPKAGYRVWVRGYGLVDSPQVQAAPGKVLNLTAAAAPNARAAAEYYPAGYWFSLLRVPDKSEFPGTGPEGNGISPRMTTQAHWLRQLKSGGC